MGHVSVKSVECDLGGVGTAGVLRPTCHGVGLAEVHRPSASLLELKMRFRTVHVPCTVDDVERQRVKRVQTVDDHQLPVPLGVQPEACDAGSEQFGARQHTLAEVSCYTDSRGH